MTDWLVLTGFLCALALLAVSAIDFDAVWSTYTHERPDIGAKFIRVEPDTNNLFQQKPSNP